jgi:two-component system chemotaxis response regulator CheB
MRRGEGRAGAGFDVVALGCSRGGLRALQTVLGELPAGFPAALLIVQHRTADGDSRLVELLQRRTRLIVSEPNDKDPIDPGHAYIAPAGYHMLAEPGWIALSTEPPVSFARPSIDALFESVADAFGAHAIAVVLTGASEDGASGAAAIHDAGGSVLVEDPTSAESPTLPGAVISRFEPDAIVPLPEIASTLIRWCRPNSSEAAIPRRT